MTNALPSLVMVLTTGSVFFASLVIVGILGKAFEMYRVRYVTRVMNELSDMFLFIDPRQLLALCFASTVILGILAYLLGNALLCLLASLYGFFVPMVVVRHFRKRRVQRFNAQLVDSLLAIANALRAGQTFQQAVEHVRNEAASPMEQELGLLLKELRLGVSMEEALNSLAGRVRSTDLNIVVLTTNIARQQGGNMAEMFETISATIRERFRLLGKIDALTAQGRLQGWIVASMPFLLGLVLNSMRPDLVRPLMNDLFGYLLVLAVVFMESVGIFFIRRVTRIVV